jgi:hypothetical protein
MPAYRQLSLPTRFRFVFSFDTKSQTQTIPPWNWHETDIEPLDDRGDERLDSNGSITSNKAEWPSSEQGHIIQTIAKTTDTASTSM